MPQVPRPAPKNPSKRSSCAGRPPRGGSGALPAPLPNCPHCEAGNVICVYHSQEEEGKTFIIERFRCLACCKTFTIKDVAAAEKTASDIDEIPSTVSEGNKVFVTIDPIVKHPPLTIPIEYEEIPDIEGESPPIHINVAGFIGNEVELASQLSEIIKNAGISVDEMNDSLKDLADAANHAGAAIEDLGDRSTGAKGEKTSVPRPPPIPPPPPNRRRGKPIEEPPKDPLPRSNMGEVARAYRDERQHHGGVPMHAEDGASPEGGNKKYGIPIERGWAERKPEPEPSRMWSLLKWVVRVIAAGALGALIEWGLA